MSDLLGTRTYSLVVAPLADDPTLNNLETGMDLSQCDIEFHVKKTLKPKPNTARIKVWGLGQGTRQYFQTTKRLTVRLEAGYNDDNEMLFLGEARSSFTVRDTAEVETIIETGDSEKDMAASGLSLTFGKATTVDQAIKAIGAALPNQLPVSAQTKLLDKLSGLHVFHPAGGAIDRSTRRYLNDLCRAAGLEWSIQNGVMFVVEKGQPHNNQIVSLSADSGMIGSPSMDHKGFVDVKSLILPGIHPGAAVYIDGESVKGTYRIDECHYSGNTSIGARDWYVRSTCTPIGQTSVASRSQFVA